MMTSKMNKQLIYLQPLKEIEADLEDRLDPEQEKFFDFAKRHLLYPNETTITFNGQSLELIDGERIFVREGVGCDVMQRRFKYDLYHEEGHPQIIRLTAFREPRIGKEVAKLFPKANVYGGFENEGYETVQEAWDYDKKRELVFLDRKARLYRKRRERNTQRHQELVHSWLKYGEIRYAKHCNLAERIYGALDELVNEKGVRDMAVACACATLMAKIDGGLNVLTYIPHAGRIDVGEYVERLHRETIKMAQQIAEFYAGKTRSWLSRKTGEEVLLAVSSVLSKEYSDMLYPNPQLDKSE